MIKASGSLRGIADMLGQGIALAEVNYKNWPSDLPVMHFSLHLGNIYPLTYLLKLLLVHGDSDKVCRSLFFEYFESHATRFLGDKS